MNSGISNTNLSDQLTEFVEYVDSFYGVNDPLYPLEKNGQPLTTVDIYGATEIYLNRISKGDLEYVHYEWGDGDSLDRERVRDILINEFNYTYKEDT